MRDQGLLSACSPVVLAIALSVGSGQGAQAQDAASSAVADQIIVIGARTSDRTVKTSPVPVDVFTGDELAASGFQNLAMALQRVAPSLNFAPDNFGGTSVNGLPATLRGLGPDQVLVLVNGHRRHSNAIINTNNTIGRGAASVDLNLIPMSAVARVEVLRDGAAAQYGSDAIAGVINIVLKSDADGGSLSAQAGVTEDNDGEYVQSSGNIGFALGDDGYFNLSGDVRLSEPTNRALPSATGDVSSNPNFGEQTFVYGSPEMTTYAVSANTGFAVTEALRFEGFSTLSYRDAETAIFFRDPNGILFTPVDGGQQFPNGYLPRVGSELIDFHLSGDVFGVISGWAWSAGAAYGYNDIDLDLTGSVNRDLVPNSPTRFDLGGFIYSQLLIDADMVRDFDVLAGMTVSAGAGFRRETYEVKPGDAASLEGAGSDGSRGAGFLGAVDESRRSYNLFAEINTDLTETLTLDLAARLEDYDDFGSQLTGKASALWRPVDLIGLRGSVSTGFRAPSLQQQYYSSASAATTASGGFVQQGLFPVGNFAARAVGAVELDAETASQFSAGLILEPFDGFSLTLDYFRTEIEDRVVLSESLSGAEVDAALASAGIDNVGAVQFFTNAVDTTTEGFEVVARYTPTLPWDADLDLTLGYVDFETDIDRIRDNPATPNLTLFGERSQIFLTRGQPEEKGHFNAAYQHGRLGVDFGVSYYGSYETLFGAVFEFGEEYVTDLAVSYDVTDALHLSFGVKNLGDAQPDTFQELSSGGLQSVLNSISIQYPVEAPFGTRGRELFARVNYAF